MIKIKNNFLKIKIIKKIFKKIIKKNNNFLINI